MLKSAQRRMNNSFSRIALVGKIEDARVADSLTLLATHLRARGLSVVVDRDAVMEGLPQGLVRRPVSELGEDADDEPDEREDSDAHPRRPIRTLRRDRNVQRGGCLGHGRAP